MKEFNFGLIAILVFIFIIPVLCIVVGETKYEMGYIQACKDFYQGKPKYDLVKHEDGTVTWEKIDRKENK